MTDQSTEGFFSPFLRRQRFRAAKPYLNGRVLDVGCGTGGLAEFIVPESYFGVDIDEECLKRAKQKFPDYFFQKDWPAISEKFDTVVSLAVIEHVSDPAVFLGLMSKHLKNDTNAQIVITTPNPLGRWIHEAGSAMGLFSKHACEEHKILLDRKKLCAIGERTGLTMVHYTHFLSGANQLAVFKTVY